MHVRARTPPLEMEISMTAADRGSRGCFPTGLSLSKPRRLQHACSYKHQVLLPQKERLIQRVVYTMRPLYLQRSYGKVLATHNQATHILEKGSIEEIYDSLAAHLLQKALSVPDPETKYMIGLAGPPGAGKSTIAFEVVSRLNKLWAQKALHVGSTDIGTIVTMDGFHLYRSQLDAMEDPEEAHARRGAPWTFNPALLLKCLQNLRTQGSVYAPSFDHGVGDPVEDDIFVTQHHKVIIVEGNYLFLEEESWKEVSSMFDEKWFVDVDINIAMQRVIKRHISTGKTPAVAKWRVEYNDRPNAELIIKSKKNADLVIMSVDWKK